MSQTKTLAEIMKAERERLGLTQYELSQRAGLSQQFVSGIELGSDPHFHGFRQICAAMNVSIDEICSKLGKPEIGDPSFKSRSRRRTKDVRLTESDLAEIVRMHKAGARLNDIAVEFEISVSYVGKIVARAAQKPKRAKAKG